MGAWIDFKIIIGYTQFPRALCMGAWIETGMSAPVKSSKLVALCMGAWIETRLTKDGDKLDASRALYGRVD